MKKIIIALVFIATGCGSKATVSKISDVDASSSNGFYYALPKSNLIITVDIEKKETEPGEYKDIANCFGFTDIITAKKKSFKYKKADVITKTYLDSAQVFKYNFSNNFLNKNEFKLEYAANGEISNSEFKNENQTVPILSTTIGLAASVYGSAAALFKEKSNKDCFNLQSRYNMLTISKTKYKSLSEAEKAKYNAELASYLADKSLFDKADKEFKYLNTIKEKYLKALSEENGANKEIVDAKIQKLEDAMDEISSKYTGVIKKTIYQATFEINPMDFINTSANPHSINTTSNADQKDLFYFDVSKGINKILVDNLIATNEEIEDASCATTIIYGIKLIKIYNESINILASKTANPQDGAAFYYRIPVTARFEIYRKNVGGSVTNIKTFDVIVPQYGLVVAAPSNMKNLNFKLHPGLGSILSVEGITKSLDVDAISKLGTASSGLIDKFKKEEEPNKKDELIKDLERDIKIKDLQQQLNSSE